MQSISILRTARRVHGAPQPRTEGIEMQNCLILKVYCKEDLGNEEHLPASRPNVIATLKRLCKKDRCRY